MPYCFTRSCRDFELYESFVKDTTKLHHMTKLMNGISALSARIVHVHVQVDRSRYRNYNHVLVIFVGTRLIHVYRSLLSFLSKSRFYK